MGNKIILQDLYNSLQMCGNDVKEYYEQHSCGNEDELYDHGRGGDVYEEQHVNELCEDVRLYGRDNKLVC